MHMGYSIDWQQVIVITWGGLRGAVGLALALVVAQTKGVPLDSIGSKVCECIHCVSTGNAPSKVSISCGLFAMGYFRYKAQPMQPPRLC